MHKFLKRYKRNIFIFFIASLLLLDAFIIYKKAIQPILIKNEAAKLTQEIQKEAQNMANECAKQITDWRNCYMDAFKALSIGNSFEFSLATLKELEKADSKARDCHLMGHAIATGEIAKNPNSWHNFLKLIETNYCSGGFIHGVFEGLNRNDPNFKLNEEILPKVCDIVKQSVKGGGGEQYCAHITGHILLAEKEGNIEEAIKVCEKVPQSIQYQCFGGLFMENITRDNLVIHGIGTHIQTTEQTTSVQQKLCETHTGFAALGCWREMAHMFVRLTNNDPQKSYALCNNAKEKKEREECFLHAAGLIVRDFNISNELKNSACDPLSGNDLFRRCLREIVFTMLSASTGYEKEVRDFCKAVENLKDQKFCLGTLDARLKQDSSPRDD